MFQKKQLYPRIDQLVLKLTNRWSENVQVFNIICHNAVNFNFCNHKLMGSQPYHIVTYLLNTHMVTDYPFICPNPIVVKVATPFTTYK